MRPGGRLRQIALTAALASVAVAAGCGGSAAPKGPPVGLPSYLAQYPPRDPVAVYFLQWEQRGEEVDGTLSLVFPTRVDTPTRTQPVKGKIDGDTISLEIGTDPPQQWEGRHVGRSIVFDADLGDAGVQQIRFVPASLAVFRRTVAKVRAGG
jgi:hypothetical protein